MSRYERKEKTGIVLPFDALPALLLLPAEEAKELVVAMLQYGQGEPPQITSPTVASIWPTYQRRIAADDYQYWKTSRTNAFNRLSKDEKAGLTREQWERLHPEEYVSLDERIAGEPPEPPQDEAEPEEAQDTADTLSAALARWIAYKEYTPEQATLERPRFEALRREHGAAAVAVAVDRAISTNAKTITIEEETK
ncbi:MAG: hypothetical protein IK099_10325 [Clostridia bacterium]|nr:hypothetical protein [Clostridia bacterium]